MPLTKPRITQINTDYSTVTDPITVLNQGSSVANVDVGFLFNRSNGLVSNVALYWSESGNTFVTAFTSASGATNSNVTVTAYANVSLGKVTSSYADIAENYTADADYPPGTVVVFGGTQEVTITNASHDARVAGVISTAPAYIMNGSKGNAAVALTGRVPCFVQGPVAKGDLLVTSNTNGVATVLVAELFVPGCIIGKSMQNVNSNNVELIEISVGRF